MPTDAGWPLWGIFLSGVATGVGVGTLIGFVVAAVCLRFAMLRTLVRMREIAGSLAERCYAQHEVIQKQAEIKEPPLKKRLSMWD
jgi:hypothetical protein